jgi:type II secretory pathway component GspD/PulD (secretin)
MSASIAWAQGEAAAKSAGPVSVQYLRLNNTLPPYATNEILVAIRNVINPSAKLTLVLSQNLIIIASTPDQIALAQAMVHELDRPMKRYRLTYTIVDMDGTRRIGEQHYSMVAVEGQKMTVKQGSKVPLTTDDSKDSSRQTVTYIDIGMSFEVQMNSLGENADLKTRVERSSVAEERSGIGPQDPIMRQSVFEGSSVLTPGKPVTLGSLDVPGSTRHLDIQVVAEQVN